MSNRSIILHAFALGCLVLTPINFCMDILIFPTEHGWLKFFLLSWGQVSGMFCMMVVLLKNIEEVKPRCRNCGEEVRGAAGAPDLPLHLDGSRLCYGIYNSSLAEWPDA